MALKSGALIGSKEEGNPYSSGIDKGISYDTYEANGTVTDGRRITTMYRMGAGFLISHLKGGREILDIGSGTGISALELLSQKPGVEVTGIEASKGMNEIAKFKFHQSSGSDFLDLVKDQLLLSYWQAFREESARYSGHVTFINDDFEKTEQIPEGYYDSAIANQALHWTDLPIAFSKLRDHLKEGGVVVWNTASFFYDDGKYPSREYGFRHNAFISQVLKVVNSLYSIRGTETIPLPKHNLDTITEVTRKAGFVTEQAGTYIIPIDLQVLIRNHVPAFVKGFIKDANCDEEETEAIISTAISRAVTIPGALEDTMHKYDIVPVFVSRRI